MTAIIALDLRSYIIVMSDFRISWSNGFEPQDYLQKIYPFGKNSLLGFSGNIEAGKRIITKIFTTYKLDGTSFTDNKNADEISLLAKNEFNKVRNTSSQS